MNILLQLCLTDKTAIMNETQEKIYGLLENYLEYCKTNGHTEFEVWCEDNIDTINEEYVLADTES